MTETNLIDKKDEDGNFHIRKQKEIDEYEKIAETKGQFQPYIQRVHKISQVLDDIVAYQQYERDQEVKF